MPKSASWVLNAVSVRSAYREKRKRGETGLGDGTKEEEQGNREKKKRKSDLDAVEESKARGSLAIKPGESLRHFNRCVSN